MLKAGRSIQVKGKKTENKQGILVAPLINLHGLILTANNPIPKEISEFLETHRVNVQQIEENGDKLVRVSGQFNISKAQVEAFLADYNKTLPNNNETKETAEAHYFKMEVLEHVKDHERNPEKLIYTFAGKFTDKSDNPEMGDQEMIEVTPPREFSPGSYKINSKEFIRLNSTKLTAVKDILLTAPTISSEGHIVQDAQAGILGVLTANGDIQMLSPGVIELRNALIQAQKDIELNSNDDEITIELTPDIEWANPTKAPSLTLSYDSKRKGPDSDATSSNLSDNVNRNADFEKRMNDKAYGPLDLFC